MRRITSALFLDFDNLLSRLIDADKDAAKVLTQSPATLVHGLAALDPGIDRHVLVRRAYLNPNGSVPNAEAKSSTARQPLSAYRGRLTRAGFEVVDCPRLAKGAKNGADIRMVVDILDAVASPVHYDEIIIASDDSDFTPLLIKLRALDRRTTIVGTGAIAEAYGASADRRIGEAELVALLAPPVAVAELRPKSMKKTESEPMGEKQPSPEKAAAKALLAMLKASDAPVTLASAGKEMRSKVRDEVGPDAMGSNWFGRRTLSAFIGDRLGNLKMDGTHVWDPARHAAPSAVA